MAPAAPTPWGRPAPPSLIQRPSTLLYTRSRLLLALLLGPPLIWLGLIYLGSLFALLIQSFFYLDGFTGLVVRQCTLATYAQLFTWSNFDIFARTTSMAAAVTVASAILAFPLAYYMARHASPRLKAFLYLAVIMPLWSSYLIRVYSWRLILAKEGILNWGFAELHLSWALDWLVPAPGPGAGRAGGAAVPAHPLRHHPAVHVHDGGCGLHLPAARPDPAVVRRGVEPADRHHRQLCRLLGEGALF